METFDLRQWKGFVAAGGDCTTPALIDQIAIDSRRIASRNSLFVALEGKNSNGHQYLPEVVEAGARFALVKENYSLQTRVPLQLLKVPDPLKSFQEIVAVYRQTLNLIVIALVGTYGKTMLKDLLVHLLEPQMELAYSPESFNSQIGVPLSVLKIKKKHQIAILEVAFSKLGELERLIHMINPTSMIITSLESKFFDRTIIAQEIQKSLEKTHSLDWILRPQHPSLLYKTSSHYFWDYFAPTFPHANMIDHRIAITFPDCTTYQSSLAFPPKYLLNLMNMAIKTAWLLGQNKNSITDKLKDYIPEPSRTEIWNTTEQTLIINDTYCGDPQSIPHSLNYFSLSSSLGKRYFLFNGIRNQENYSDKDFKSIGKMISCYAIDGLFLTEENNNESLVKTIRQDSPTTEIIQSATLWTAINEIKTILSPHDTLLIKGKQKIPFDSFPLLFGNSHEHTQCCINFSIIRENIISLRSYLNSGKRMMIMVKAFAYGTDHLRMSYFLSQCGIDILGVSYVKEAIELRKANVSQDIFVLHSTPNEIEQVITYDLQIGVSNASSIALLEQEAFTRGKRIKVHLHIDTGMKRFGCTSEEAVYLAKKIYKSSHLQLEGIMTHFTSAEDPNDDLFTIQQAALLEKAVSAIHSEGIEIPWIHAENSAAAIRYNFPQYNMARIGLAVYGLYSSDIVRNTLNLKLAISLRTRIVNIQTCSRGDTISYGRSYQVKKPQEKIAIIPIGYSDGLHRKYSNKNQVMIRGMRVPIVGKICMDFMFVDITDLPEVEIGEPVLIFGEDDNDNFLPPEQFAQQGNSIVHELISCLGPRVQRIFLFEEATTSVVQH